jgi:hypothetical protein
MAAGWVEAEKKLKETLLCSAHRRATCSFSLAGDLHQTRRTDAQVHERARPVAGVTQPVATTHHIGPKPWEFTGEDEDDRARKHFS